MCRGAVERMEISSNAYTNYEIRGAIAVSFIMTGLILLVSGFYFDSVDMPKTYIFYLTGIPLIILGNMILIKSNKYLYGGKHGRRKAKS